VVANGIGIINNSNGYMATNGASNGFALNPLWNYADTLSWSRGRHSFKFGGEVRLPRTDGNGLLQPYPSVTYGNASATATPSPFGTAANFATELPGLLSTAVQGGNAARGDVTNLLYYLSGSVASASHPYWVTNF